MKILSSRIVSALAYMVVICVMFSCATSSHVATSHNIQKRKYQKGFHVLNLNKKKAKKSSTLERLEPISSRSISEATLDTIKEPAAPFKFSKKYKPPVFSDSSHEDLANSNADSLAKRSEYINIIPEDDEIIEDSNKRKPKDDRPPRKNNYFALWVFIGTIVSIALIATGIGILLLLVCILLADAAERKEGDGRRFSKLAGISLVMGIFALCITLAILGVVFSFAISFGFAEFSFLFLLIGLSITSVIVKFIYQGLIKLRGHEQSSEEATNEDSKNEKEEENGFNFLALLSLILLLSSFFLTSAAVVVLSIIAFITAGILAYIALGPNFVKKKGTALARATLAIMALLFIISAFLVIISLIIIWIQQQE